MFFLRQDHCPRFPSQSVHGHRKIPNDGFEVCKFRPKTTWPAWAPSDHLLVAYIDASKASSTNMVAPRMSSGIEPKRLFNAIGCGTLVGCVWDVIRMLFVCVSKWATCHQVLDHHKPAWNFFTMVV
jgi:hypothetical protein